MNLVKYPYLCVFDLMSLKKYNVKSEGRFGFASALQYGEGLL